MARHRAARRGHALIAAPTGSGKTLAAFLPAINVLVVEALSARGGLGDEVHVLYVSPLKALSNDIRKNPHDPLASNCLACWRWACPPLPMTASGRPIVQVVQPQRVVE